MLGLRLAKPMSRLVIRLLVTAVLLSCSVLKLQAQVTVYTWTGLSGSTDFYTSANWAGNLPPPNVLSTDTAGIANALANTQIVLGNSGFYYTYYYELYANKLTLRDNVMGYYVQGDYDTTHIGAGGITYAPATSVTSVIAGRIRLEADQTWDVQNSHLFIEHEVGDSTFDGNLWVSDNHTITKTGAGRLSLKGNNQYWDGGLVLTAGQVTAFARFDSYYYTPLVSYSLGTGTLTFNGGTLVAAGDPYYSDSYYPNVLVLENDIVSNGLISVAGYVPTSFENSTLTLNANTTIKVTGQSLYIHSNIVESGGARKLTIDSAVPVIIEGTSGWTGGTEVINQGILVFGGTNSLPVGSSTIKVSSNGYVGTGNGNSVATFLTAFDKANTLGSIGFDSDLDSLPDSFSSAIDLTGFSSSVRLGSASHAILTSTATITPQGTSYRFGGGGGWLQVDSALTGTNSLVLDSPPSRPLTLRLTNDANNWSGGTSVTQSGLIFGSAPGGSFSGSAGSITVNQGGYVGFELWGDQTTQQFVDNSLSLINSASIGAVGFDGVDLTGATINLSSFSGALYLGTADVGYIDDGFGGGLLVSGTITPAGGAGAPFRFAGYKGGLLEVASTLTGTNGIVIGDPNSPATFGDPVQQELSTVALSGSNSGLSGNILFYGGQLGVSQSNGISGTDPTNALGTGNLIVQGMTLPTEWADADGLFPHPKLVVENFDTIIPNNVVLNTDLAVGGWPDFELAGTISGTGGLDVEDGIGLTLSGNNTFSGGIYLYGSSALYLDHNNAAGTGPLEFGNSSGAEVYFNTAAPVIGGLANPKYEVSDDYAYLYATQPNAVLTINQSADGIFGGEFRSTDASDAMRLVKTGTGSLGLGYGGLYFYNGTTEATLPGSPQVSLQINQGTVVIGNDFYIEGSAPTIWVHGGTLALANSDGYYSIYNPIVVDNGGRITGNGYLSTSLSIGAGATLSPGAAFPGENPIGRLDLWHLDAKAGGTLEWDIMQADPTSAMWDQITVSTPSTLDFSTINLTDPNTAPNRFTLKVISRTLTGSQGLLTGFDPSLNYSWLVFSTDGIAAFNPGKVIIDSSLFANSLDAGSGNGYFFLSQVGNNMFLNFSPVPEPSTYALMIAGLAVAGLSWRRRAARRAS